MAAPSTEVVPWRAWEGLDGVLYQFTPGDGSYSLLVTDLTQLWSETLDADSFLRRLRELNPSLEATAEQALPCLTEAVGSRDGGAVWSGAVLRLDSRRGGVPLHWTFQLQPLPTAELAERLMRPLLSALGLMQAREERLLSEVAARDRELEDYRQSGAHLTLRSLRTVPLDRDRFESEMTGRGLRPSQLVDASAWRAAPPPPPPTPVKESPVKVAPVSPRNGAAAAPPEETEREKADRRRRELKQRLDQEAKRSETEKKTKKKRLNL